MAFDYINEAFKRLSILDEEMFDTSIDGIKELDSFMNQDIEDETINVIDPEATTEEDLSTSYVGKVIVNCNVCHSHVFNNKEDITIDETDGTVNADVTCPYCGESEGFVIVGEIAPFNSSEEPSEEPETETTDAVEDKPEEVEEPVLEEGLVGDLTVDLDVDASNSSVGFLGGTASTTNEKVEEEKMSRASRRCMQEDFKEVSITTEDQKLEMSSDENGKVTVTTEPIESAPVEEETIVPVSDETQDELLQANDIQETEEMPEEEEFDFDFEDVDEEGFDELGEGYLKNVYENVNSYKTTGMFSTPTQLIVEGVITFNSGAQKKTGFVFEAKDANAKGQLRFVGSNKHLCESADAFSLVGRVDNKKLFVESLKYNYSVNENVVRGRVRRK